MATPVPLPFDEPPQRAPRKSNPVRAERQRLTANALRVLEFLKTRGERGATNAELCTPEIGGLRGIGRVNELVHDGWQIEKVHVSGGTWRYTLKGYR